MKRKLTLLRLANYTLLMIWFPGNALSQPGTPNSMAVTDTIKSVLKESPHSLYAGTGYGSNLIYLGSTISRDQPYGFASLTYGFKNEFFASLSTIHLTDINPFLAFYTGSLNYSHVFNSWLDMSVGIYRYHVAPSLTDTLFSNFTYGDLGLGFDWKLIYSRISAGGLLSDENMAYFQIKNSRYFQTPELLNNKLNISFDPYVNLLFGTLIKAETTTGTIITLSSPYRKWRNANQSTSTTTYSRTFGIMEIDLGLPVAFNTDRLTIEAEVSYVLPVYDDPDFPGRKGFVFLLSGYFRFF